MAPWRSQHEPQMFSYGVLSDSKKPKLPKQIDQKTTTRLFRGQKKKRNEQTRLRPRNCLPRRRGNYKQIVVSEKLWPILRPRETERQRDWKPEMQLFGNSEKKLSRIWSARGELQQNENKFALKRTRERERERERELDAARSEARETTRSSDGTRRESDELGRHNVAGVFLYIATRRVVFTRFGKKGLFTRVTTYNTGSPATPRSTAFS